jgi:hypothetical protein
MYNHFITYFIHYIFKGNVSFYLVTMDLLVEEVRSLSVKIDCLVELSQSLIKQNIKLTDTLYGKLKVPDEITPDTPKDLFYYTTDNKVFYIHGPGTFDNKATIKSIPTAEWDRSSKAWRMIIEPSELLDKFPNIKPQDLKTVKLI